MVSVSCSWHLLLLVTVIVLTASLSSIYEYHQATAAPLFLASVQTLTGELITVSRAFLVLLAVLEHWNFVLPASRLGTLHKTLVGSLAYQDL